MIFHFKKVKIEVRGSDFTILPVLPVLPIVDNILKINTI